MLGGAYTIQFPVKGTMSTSGKKIKKKGKRGGGTTAEQLWAADFGKAWILKYISHPSLQHSSFWGGILTRNYLKAFSPKNANQQLSVIKKGCPNNSPGREVWRPLHFQDEKWRLPRAEVVLEPSSVLQSSCSQQVSSWLMAWHRVCRGKLKLKRFRWRKQQWTQPISHVSTLPETALP